MREIKFRGKTLGDELFFGDLIQSNGEPSIFDGTHRKYVKPESVAQLVGYDADGNEVFDKDEVIDIEDGEMPWGGNPRLAVVDEDCNFLGDIGDSFEDVKLKES